LYSWFLPGVGVIAGRRLSRSASLWYGALLSTLVFPHSAMATGTLLTERAALLFALLGALAVVMSALSQLCSGALLF
jgi:hypothetical protein